MTHTKGVRRNGSIAWWQEQLVEYQVFPEKYTICHEQRGLVACMQPLFRQDGCRALLSFVTAGARGAACRHHVGNQQGLPGQLCTESTTRALVRIQMIRPGLPHVQHTRTLGIGNIYAPHP